VPHLSAERRRAVRGRAACIAASPAASLPPKTATRPRASGAKLVCIAPVVHDEVQARGARARVAQAHDVRDPPVAALGGGAEVAHARELGGELM
jgi:hypothetical protein